MRRVLLAGSIVAVGDGVLLGTTIALGWTALTVVAVVLGAAGVAVAMAVTPPARAPARGATVTLGLPLREVAPREAAQEVTTEAGAAVGQPTPVAA